MTHNIYWIGSNDWTTERFENLFPIPNGVSYNSFFIDDEKDLCHRLSSVLKFVKILRQLDSPLKWS